MSTFATDFTIFVEKLNNRLVEQGNEKLDADFIDFMRPAAEEVFGQNTDSAGLLAALIAKKARKVSKSPSARTGKVSMYNVYISLAWHLYQQTEEYKALDEADKPKYITWISQNAAPAWKLINITKRPDDDKLKLELTRVIEQFVASGEKKLKSFMATEAFTGIDASLLAC